MHIMYYFSSFFFFNDTATTEIYTLSLHDALPISAGGGAGGTPAAGHRPAPGRTDLRCDRGAGGAEPGRGVRDRKSTRLNSSHANISYAVFCLKKKKTTNRKRTQSNSKTTRHDGTR